MPDQNSKSFQQCVIEYEKALAAPERVDLASATVLMLDGIASASSQGGFVEKGLSISVTEHWYTRTASALTQFITHPDTRISLVDAEQITWRKQAIGYVFSASGFRNMSHLVDLITLVQKDGRETSSPARAAVLLIFIGLDDATDRLMDIALEQPKDLLLLLMLGWLNQRAVLTPQGEKNRGRLLISGHLLADVEIKDKHIPHIVNAWMYSSYATEPKKHQIKRVFNELLRKRIGEAGIVPSVPRYRLTTRPKVLVIHERFTAAHAMFRCYSPILRTLNEYFDTVAIAESEMIDAAAETIFDQVIRLDSPRPAVDQLVELVQAQNADIIIYPSLGMSHWTVMLATLRLAPLQIMTQGHPATSMLDTIDFVYLTSLRGDPSLHHSERIIAGPTTLNFETHSDLAEDLPALLPPSHREVHIAVNSKVMKLSWRLLEVCKRLESEATVAVKFFFFPGERLGYMDGIDAAIRAQLPSATVMPYMEYEEFLSAICKCDMALASFPFGNTNSTVDACLLGLPTVAHFGPESPAQTDALVLQTVGLADWLVTGNDEDYFQVALKLVNNESERVAAMSGVDRMTARARLTGNCERLRTEPFGELVYNLHQHLPALVGASKRTFSYQEILQLQVNRSD